MRLAAICALVWIGSSSVHAQSTTVDFPVPVIAINPGEAISDGNLVERRLLANGAALRSYHTSRADLVGKVAKRVLPAGAAIPINALRDPYVFREGERVVVAFTSAGLAIRGSAIALEPGIVGRSAKVRNVDTGVVVSGVVQADGVVELGGG